MSGERSSPLGLCAEHVRQLESESPLPNLTQVKGCASFSAGTSSPLTAWRAVGSQQRLRRTLRMRLGKLKHTLHPECRTCFSWASALPITLNPAVAAGRNPDRPTAQPVTKKAVITRRVSCAAVGNCWYQRPCLAVWGMNCRIQDYKSAVLPASHKYIGPLSKQTDPPDPKKISEVIRVQRPAPASSIAKPG